MKNCQEKLLQAIEREIEYRAQLNKVHNQIVDQFKEGRLQKEGLDQISDEFPEDNRMGQSADELAVEMLNEGELTTEELAEAIADQAVALRSEALEEQKSELRSFMNKLDEEQRDLIMEQFDDITNFGSASLPAAVGKAMSEKARNDEEVMRGRVVNLQSMSALLASNQDMNDERKEQLKNIKEKNLHRLLKADEVSPESVLFREVVREIGRNHGNREQHIRNAIVDLHADPDVDERRVIAVAASALFDTDEQNSGVVKGLQEAGYGEEAWEKIEGYMQIIRDEGR